MSTSSIVKENDEFEDQENASDSNQAQTTSSGRFRHRNKKFNSIANYECQQNFEFFINLKYL